jgi:transcriptional antiterminator RfaH
MRWYAAKTKPRQEHTALEHLRRQNFETYCPRIMIERLKSTGIRRELEPLCPGYVLIRFDLSDTTWRVINSTRGISKLLSFTENGTPTAITPGSVESLKALEAQGKLFISEVTRLHRGDKVRIKFGTLSDRIAEVVFSQGNRITLLLNLLGRKVPIKAPLHALEVVQGRHTKARSPALVR